MTENTPKPTLDAEVIAFAQKVFGYARVGNAAALESLLEQGMPANLLNDKGDSLLMLAAYHGHADATRVLLAHGGDTAHANDRGQLPLGAATFKGDRDIVEALLDGGASVDGAGPDGRTALMYAAMFNRTGDPGPAVGTRRRSAGPRRHRHDGPPTGRADGGGGYGRGCCRRTRTRGECGGSPAKRGCQPRSAPAFVPSILRR